jgi:hypothetical protein
MKELFFAINRFCTLLKKILKRTFDQTSLIRYLAQRKKGGTVSTVAFGSYILCSSVITKEVKAMEQTYSVGKICRNL